MYKRQDYALIEKGGTTIAAFGILGKEANAFAPESGLYFKDPVETANAVVNEIKKQERVDAIVCLSHSGTSDAVSYTHLDVYKRQLQK